MLVDLEKACSALKANFFEKAAGSARPRLSEIWIKIGLGGGMVRILDKNWQKWFG
jgi:hypothetical protein